MIYPIFVLAAIATAFPGGSDDSTTTPTDTETDGCVRIEYCRAVIGHEKRGFANNNNANFIRWEKSTVCDSHWGSPSEHLQDCILGTEKGTITTTGFCEQKETPNGCEIRTECGEDENLFQVCQL
jgi:hypothetical protein